MEPNSTELLSRERIAIETSRAKDDGVPSGVLFMFSPSKRINRRIVKGLLWGEKSDLFARYVHPVACVMERRYHW